MGNPYYDPSYNPYPPPVLIGTGILFIIVPVAAALLRFYVRMHTAARLGIDDWLAIPAVVICVGVATAQIIGTQIGHPLHPSGLIPKLTQVSIQLRRPQDWAGINRSTSTASRATHHSSIFMRKRGIQARWPGPPDCVSSSSPCYSSSAGSSGSELSSSSTTSSFP